ncbi:hypothetical protein [Alienimonas californiensis]|uniref:Uncharacterized protein n=1 Tax=Alienimonas californiensis TaxID=2527989 RepID=A0A517PBA5_9PLAN|nr:hypothetical protein [Alienimonas californiensis]QDT16657.1 hypothetical protein CA12_27630 [Alienimonas californiensis]
MSKPPRWLFDDGLWSLTNDLTVLVANGRFFREAAPDQRALADYAGRQLRMPNVEANRPDPTCLRWHRRKVFLG